MYDMTTGPFGTLRAAEHLEIRDGKIVAGPIRSVGSLRSSSAAAKMIGASPPEWSMFSV